MYFDIDDFKLYNDRYGHAAGDEVLRESIAALRDSIRAGDLVFRMGGDEFVVLFCDPNPPRRGGSGVPENVEEIAERCRAAVRRLQLPLLADSGPGPVTISAGCALFPWDAANADELIALADKRALEAKRLGKDQINFGPDRSSEHFSG
jgi:diguanylate cyclase (GGDEF)-like protein